MNHKDPLFKELENNFMNELLKDNELYHHNKKMMIEYLLLSLAFFFLIYFSMGSILLLLSSFGFISTIVIASFSAKIMYLEKSEAELKANDMAQKTFAEVYNLQELLTENKSQQLPNELSLKNLAKIQSEVQIKSSTVDLSEFNKNPNLAEEDIVFLQNIKYLIEYVNDVAYDGYEEDLQTLWMINNYIALGSDDENLKVFIKNSMGVIADNILNKACYKYGLAPVRKLD